MQTQVLRSSRSLATRSLVQRNSLNLVKTRCFGSTQIPNTTGAPQPWFVDEPLSRIHRAQPPHLPTKQSQAPPLPEDAPSILKHLHAQLLKSPHLEQSQLVVSQAILPEPGPLLALKKPQGRRKRGGIFGVETGYDAVSGGLWSWVVMTQVKEGTEGRGAIESVVRLVRKSLLTHDPPVPLPPKSRRKNGTEWAMIDAGKFAVHILSRGAREKYFNKEAAW
ncbi:hypothetical protein CPB83DRAFT_758709 [Crepidotus variabilis]|uniref:Uncharacterized protein n=1 Tax=Crepidotus variabilis TaxID=179855 RepID=A0A9P6EQ91_9AGAR|nr:hypothetical protein CPB83DRAFT_758709 [Crepidotus variabilis]